MRRVYVDWARGLAVLAMIEAHTLDAWTRLADRSTPAFRNLTILGGFAAPFFLWLAGLSLVLSAEAACARSGDRRATTLAAVQRGVWIFILAFLFRLQALIVTPGSPLLTLFRVDILNIMGPALVSAALLWGLVQSRLQLSLLYGALAGAIAMVTSLVRTASWVNRLPIWLQWYMRPAGEYTTFTAFPWIGFVFAGAAVGIVLARFRDQRSERSVHLTIAAVGVALVTLGLKTAALPSIYPSSSFWTSSPTYYAIRVGVLMLALALMFGLSEVSRRAGVTLTPLQKLGRSSRSSVGFMLSLSTGIRPGPFVRGLPGGRRLRPP